MVRSTIAILIFLLTIPALSHALTGKVISIADGDTITILDSSNRQHKIRLYGIDTPEKKNRLSARPQKSTQQALLQERQQGMRSITSGKLRGMFISSKYA